MPPLHTLPTLRTPADGNVKTPYPRPAHDLFLILRLDPLYGQGTGARRTLRWNRRADVEEFHSGRPACGLGISDESCAGLAKRSRLTPGRALRGLQLLL